MERRDDRRTYRQFFPPPPDDPPERQGAGSFLALVATLAVVGAGLLQFWGLPHPPRPMATPAEVQSTLVSGALPYGAIIFAGATLLWGLWLWTAGTLLLQLALALADATTRGARWVASLRALADRVTLPLVRRTARQVVVAATVVQLASRAVPSVAAAPAPANVTVSIAQSPHPAAASPVTKSAASDGAVWHRVEPGENLWVLAERYYGDGEQWRRILAANVGRPMAGGATFPPTAQIQSGWLVRIPGPMAQHAVPAAVPHSTYVVQPGDTLSAIARRSYGDANAWPRLFAANRGARLADGHVLTDPDLIWPGLVLTIPGVAQPAAPLPSAPAAAAGPAAPGAPAQRTSPPLHAQPARRAPATVMPAATPSPVATARITRPTAAVPPAPIANAPAPTTAPRAPSPVATPTAVATVAHSPSSGGPAPLFASGLAAVAAGGVVLLARRRARTSRDEPPLPSDYRAGIPLHGGFADAAAAPTFARRLEGGREPAVLVAEQVLACLAAEEGLQPVQLLAVHEGRHALAVTLQAGLEAQGRLLAIAPDLAERLGAHGVAARTPDHDIFLQLSDLTLLELAARPQAGLVAPVPLVALGVSPRGEAVHANWELLGHTLIAGLPDGGADVVFTSLLAALAARRHPDHLALWTIAPHANFPPPLWDLPQQRNGVFDPANEAGVQTMLAEVRAELERRMGAAGSLDGNTARPDVVLAVHELADLPDDDGLLDLLSRSGAAHGVHLLAATTRPEAIADAALGCFGTRLVLRTADEAQSVRLLGQPDAADLAGGGDLFARLEGREPLRLRGFRVEPDYLARLVEMMRTAFTRPPSATPACSPVAPDPAAADSEPSDGKQESGPGSPAPQSKASAPVAMVVVRPISPTESPAYSPPTGVGRSLDIPSPGDPGCVNGRAASPSSVAVATPPAVSAAAAGIEPASEAPTAAMVTPMDAFAVPAPSGHAGVRLTIRCFGDLEVLGDGRPIAPGINQRPWELLLYLALQPASGVSRDTILGTFWAEVEQQQAADRLNTALSRLRTLLARALPDLPSDVVRLERDGVCHLDAALVWSDAQEFLALREAARRQPPAAAAATLECARALYRGEVFRQPAYPWLDEPGEDALTLRESFEEAHAVLSERLARLYADLGQPAKAAPLYRDLLRREPAIQQLAPALYRCYQALGDREELLRAHQELDAALARNRRRAEATGEDVAAYRLAPATVAAYDEAFAALEAYGA